MEVNQELVIKVVLSILAGGIIGMEREVRSKSAGFRTLILICLGAMLFTVFSQVIGGQGNPDRIASNVVTGIGFLGAGVIFRNNYRVNGITTAASIWIAAALGMGIGCGYYITAILCSLLVVAILFLFSFFDTILDRINQLREYKITFPYEEHQQHRYEDLIKEYGLKIYSRRQSKNGNIITGYWTVGGNEKDHYAFIDYILKDQAVSEFSF